MDIRLGRHLDWDEYIWNDGDNIVFPELPGSPSISVTADGRLRISFDGNICIMPKADNVVEVGMLR